MRGPIGKLTTWLRGARCWVGVGLGDLSQATGIDIARLSQIEEAKAMPTIDEVSQIDRALSVLNEGGAPKSWSFVLVQDVNR